MKVGKQFRVLTSKALGANPKGDFRFTNTNPFDTILKYGYTDNKTIIKKLSI